MEAISSKLSGLSSEIGVYYKRKEFAPIGSVSSKLSGLSSEIGVYSKRKEFAPIGSKFFPFNVMGANSFLLM